MAVLSKLMVCCFVCDHFLGNGTCGFFKFPTDPELLTFWLYTIQNVNPYEPSLHSYICSCHFDLEGNYNFPTIFFNGPVSHDQIGGEHNTCLRNCIHYMSTFGDNEL